MAYYAQLDENTVTEVIVISDDVADGAQFCHDLILGIWVQTFIDDPKKTYAGIGYTYDYATQDFIAPQPYPSWTLDSNHDWQPPTPKPNGDYYWNETELAWVAI